MRSQHTLLLACATLLALLWTTPTRALPLSSPCDCSNRNCSQLNDNPDAAQADQDVQVAKTIIVMLYHVANDLMFRKLFQKPSNSSTALVTPRGFRLPKLNKPTPDESDSSGSSDAAAYNSAYWDAFNIMDFGSSDDSSSPEDEDNPSSEPSAGTEGTGMDPNTTSIPEPTSTATGPTASSIYTSGVPTVDACQI